MLITTFCLINEDIPWSTVGDIQIMFGPKNMSAHERAPSTGLSVTQS